MTFVQAANPAVREKAKLQKTLRRLDLVLFTACAIITIDTLAFTASVGDQAITWLAISFALFLIPYGMLVAELGAAFPAEGGAYEWSRLAFGRLAGAITAVLYWIGNPIWIGGALTATSIAVINTFVLGPHSKLGTTGEIAFGLVCTWVIVGTAVVSLRYGKWVASMGLVLKALLIASFAALTVAYILKHGQTGTVRASSLKPSANGFLAVIGVLMYNWIGFDLASGASEEMVNPQKDVPRMIVKSGLIAALLYATLIAAIFLVIPTSSLSKVTGFPDAYQSVTSVLGGSAHTVGVVIAVTIVLAQFMTGATWLIGSDRVQAIAALDGAAPRWMGRFSQSLGTPIVVNVLSGMMASLFVFFVFYFSRGSLASFFSVMIALVISTTALGYLLVFPALPVLRRTRPDVDRPYRVPGGMVGCWACTILTELFAIVTATTLLWPGLLDRLLGHRYSISDSWSVSRMFFETVTLGTVAAIVLLAVAFWYYGKRERKRDGITGEAYELTAERVPETSSP
jgi:glutamate:GABA antiporter